MTRILTVIKEMYAPILANAEADTLSPHAKLAIAQHEKSLALIPAIFDDLGFESIVYPRSELVHRLSKIDLSTIDYIISVGGDGTFLDTVQKISQHLRFTKAKKDFIPIIGVNSSPLSSVGKLTAADTDTLVPLLKKIISSQVFPQQVYQISIEIHGALINKFALNDILFAHSNPAATSRYLLALNDSDYEFQKSSGIWISTGLGSTGAMFASGGKIFSHSSQDLQFRVREPYFGNNETFYSFFEGFFSPQQTLRIKSLMNEGMIFFDGNTDAHSLAYGEEFIIRIFSEPILVFLNMVAAS